MKKNELYVKLISGKDVCEVESQALITATDSKGIWCGKVDLAIRDKAGDYFHQSLFGHIRQKTGAFMFEDGEVIEIFGNKSALNVGFNNIIFVIDDCVEPLSVIVEQALEKANEDGYEVVSMSAIRAGESFGRKEKTFEEMAKELSKGIHNFFKGKDKISIKKLLILTYDKENYKELLINEFSKVDDITVIL
jgi:O-acetyl-ADP-ribose deacetylase (regulator of RNase III)